MNAAIETLPARAPVAAPHSTHKFKLLLKREFWEHKGGFFWAPVITGAVALIFTGLAAIGGSVLRRQHGNQFEFGNATSDEIARALGGAGDVALLGGILLTMLVLGVVVFFYSLGSLYDDRKDRSILFWKSLPVSDASTVASKAVWALAIAPVLSVVAGIALGLSLWVITALTTSVNGLPGASGVFTHSHPFQVVANVVAMLPLYSLWALPAVGWLMLCSAAVRTKPFLWAVIVPVLGCALISFANLVLGFGFDVSPIWYAVAYRPLLSVFPASWLPVLDVDMSRVNGPENIANVIDAGQHWALAGTADLWIGALIGAAFIAASVRLRRWRDEG
jgi:ABC-2 type transport system permease protein